VVTVTFTLPPPDGPEGVVPLHEVVEEQVTPVAAFPVPKSTVVPPEAVENLVPAMVNDVPPTSGPEVGVMEERVGDVAVV
jgi:hypothetical protein